MQQPIMPSRAHVHRFRTAVMAAICAFAVALGLLVVGTGGLPRGVAAPAGTVHRPDLRTIVPRDSLSIVHGDDGRELRYTHLIYNAGPGPLDIRPFRHVESGTYLGRQRIQTHNTSGRWAVVARKRVPDRFAYHAAHGHFHFPMASFGLYRVAPGGGLGGPVALSPKIGFCIADSYIYNQDLPHSGVHGYSGGTCDQPTAVRGVSVGGADEYDYRDPGQAVPIDGVANGTYWFRALSDPNNDFAEADEANNEVDLRLRLSGDRVTVLGSRHPDTTPHAVRLRTPAESARLRGRVRLEATTSAPAGSAVRFLVDGRRVGGVDRTTPYAVTWNTASVANGSHWLAARVIDPRRRSSSSSRVVGVRVANASATGDPLITLNDPEPGSTLSGITGLGATAGDDRGVTSVQFRVDGQEIGNPRVRPPYALHWDSRAVSDGTHEITATAADAAGNSTTSRPASVTVDNSGPVPARIAVAEQVSVRGRDTLRAPITARPGRMLVAFVAMDGPAGQRQRATVAGGGLRWVLVKRSNTQTGTAEIWAARARRPVTAVAVSAEPRRTGHRGMLSVLAFRQVAGTGVAGAAGAPTGEPDVYVPGVRAGSWVFAVGNDPDRAATRVAVPGQVLRAQWLAENAASTFWVQSTRRPSTTLSVVDVHDRRPRDDQWNYVAVELRARLR